MGRELEKEVVRKVGRREGIERMRGWREGLNYLTQRRKRKKYLHNRGMYRGNGPHPLRTEIEKGNIMKANRKAAGADNIPIELLKLGKEEAISIVCRFFGRIGTGIRLRHVKC